MGKFFASVFGFCAGRQDFDNQLGVTKQFAGSDIAWVAGDNDIGIVVGATAADFDLDIGDVNPAAIGLNLWVEGTIEVEGDIVVGDAASGHGNDGAMNVFVAEFLERFPF